MVIPQEIRRGGGHRSRARSRWRMEFLRDVGGGALAIGLVSAGILVANLIGGHDVIRVPVNDSPAVVISPTAAAAAPSVTTSSAPAVVTPTKAPVPAKPALFVLNSSSVQKLAARAASGFRAKGWPITGTGNTKHSVVSTTVFYLPGQEQAARRLMDEFEGVERMSPRPPGLEGTGMTVVLTRDYRA